MESYPVPFDIDRTRSPHLRIRNHSRERLRGVTVTLHGAGLLAVSPIAVLAPQDVLEVRARGEDLEIASSLIVRWIRPDDSEYLWRVAF